MKTLLHIGALCGALAAAVPVSADNLPTSMQTDIKLTGTVPQQCTFSSISLSGDASYEDVSLGKGTATFGTFIEPTSGRHPATTLTFTFANASCNFASYLGLTSLKSGIKPTGLTPVDGFSSVVHYVATAAWGSNGPKTTLDTTSGSSGDKNGVLLPPIADTLTLTIKTKPSPLPLLAVTNPYVDILSIKIGEQI